MSFYKQLPNVLLIVFFIEINKNIEKGTLSKNMYYEIDLIKTEIKNRNISPKTFEQIHRKYLQFLQNIHK